MSFQSTKLNGIFILDSHSTDLIYGPEERRAISELVHIVAPAQTRESIRENPGLLADVDLVFAGWGAAVWDEELLSYAPHLKAVFHGAGSIKPFTTEAFWNRDIVITSAYAANAVPVAEYTLATVLLSLKQFWRYSADAKKGLSWGDHTRPMIGAFRSTVGFISCGVIARKTLELLKPFDLKRVIYCPFLSEEEAAEMNVELVTLPEVFRRSHVVSLHTPLLPETEGLITGKLFSLMCRDATFINTARGGVVRQNEMIEVLRQRPDLTAVLDVTDPEPPKPDDPLLQLPNVVVSPHIAGSMGHEIRRLGHHMVEELRRYLAAEPLRWQITQEASLKMA